MIKNIIFLFLGFVFFVSDSYACKTPEQIAEEQTQFGIALNSAMSLIASKDSTYSTHENFVFDSNAQFLSWKLTWSKSYPRALFSQPSCSNLKYFVNFVGMSVGVVPVAPGWVFAFYTSSLSTGTTCNVTAGNINILVVYPLSGDIDIDLCDPNDRDGDGLPNAYDFYPDDPTPYSVNALMTQKDSSGEVIYAKYLTDRGDYFSLGSRSSNPLDPPVYLDIADNYMDPFTLVPASAGGSPGGSGGGAVFPDVPSTFDGSAVADSDGPGDLFSFDVPPVVVSPPVAGAGTDGGGGGGGGFDAGIPILPDDTSDIIIKKDAENLDTVADNTARLGDYLASIDSTLKGMQKADVVNGSLGGGGGGLAKSDLGALESGVSGLGEKIDGLGGKIDGLNGVDGLGGKIDSLGNGLGEKIDGLGEKLSGADGVADKIDELKEEVTKDDPSYSDSVDAPGAPDGAEIGAVIDDFITGIDQPGVTGFLKNSGFQLDNVSSVLTITNVFDGGSPASIDFADWESSIDLLGAGLLSVVSMMMGLYLFRG